MDALRLLAALGAVVAGAETAQAQDGRPSGAVGSLLSPGGHFRVHWFTAEDAEVAPEWAAAADMAWTLQIDDWGFRAPLADGSDGGGPEFDIYLEPGAYPSTSPAKEEPSTPRYDTSSFIVLYPDHEDPFDLLVHELHHGTQYAHDAAEADMLWEATATYLEDLAAGGHGYLWGTTRDFQSVPERALGFGTYDDYSMYGAAIWITYLAEVRYGGDGIALVKAMWTHAEQEDDANSHDYFAALRDMLPEMGLADLAEMFAEFAGYRVLAGTDAEGTFVGASTWASPPRVATWHVSDDDELTSSVMRMASRYVDVELDGRDAAEVTLAGDPAVGWAITATVWPASSERARIITARADADGHASLSLVGLEGVRKLTVAFSNVGTAEELADTSWTDDPDGHTHDLMPHAFQATITPRGEAPPPRNGCRVAVASVDPADAAPGGAVAAGAALLVVLAGRRRAAGVRPAARLR